MGSSPVQQPSCRKWSCAWDKKSCMNLNMVTCGLVYTVNLGRASIRMSQDHVEETGNGDGGQFAYDLINAPMTEHEPSATRQHV